MKKYVGPYECLSMDDVSWWGRRVLGSQEWFEVWEDKERGWFVIGMTFSSTITRYTGTAFSTREEAMNTLDCILIENGYTILSKERFKKLQALL